jgi:hypothetical protein
MTPERWEKKYSFCLLAAFLRAAARAALPHLLRCGVTQSDRNPNALSTHRTSLMNQK